MAESIQTQIPASAATPTPSMVAESRTEYLFTSQRARRQLGLFCAGVGFFALTSLITRRSLIRRYKDCLPKFYQRSNQGAEVNGAVEALEALSLATINVTSVGIMGTAGVLYAFDISSLADIRTKVRRHMGMNPTGSEKDLEEDIEKWFATMLESKDKKEKLADMVKKLQHEDGKS